MCGARLIVDEREFAEVFAHAEYAENHFASVFGDEHDFHTTGAHDEQRIARIVFEQDDAPFWIALLAHELAEMRELGGVERFK